MKATGITDKTEAKEKNLGSHTRTLSGKMNLMLSFSNAGGTAG